MSREMMGVKDIMVGLVWRLLPFLFCHPFLLCACENVCNTYVLHVHFFHVVIVVHVCVCLGEWTLKSSDWEGAMEGDQMLVIQVSGSHDQHVTIM